MTQVSTCPIPVEAERVEHARLKSMIPARLSRYGCSTAAFRDGTSDAFEVATQLITQDDNSYLEEAMLEKGFFLTCTSYPKADITIKTNQEDNVFD